MTWWPWDTRKNVIEDFVRTFPNHCPVCSFHRYGLREGYTKAAAPEPHDCIEKTDYGVTT